MLVGYMKEGKHGSRLRGVKEGRSEWIGTEGAEPGTGSRGRGPRSDHRELCGLCGKKPFPGLGTTEFVGIFWAERDRSALRSGSSPLAASLPP